MITSELTAQQLIEEEQDRLEDLRTAPIYQAQRQELAKFCDWMNSKHPNGAQFRVMPKHDDMKPYLDCVKDFMEFKGEGTDELNFDACTSEDAYKILWELFKTATA